MRGHGSLRHNIGEITCTQRKNLKNRKQTEGTFFIHRPLESLCTCLIFAGIDQPSPRLLISPHLFKSSLALSPLTIRAQFFSLMQPAQGGSCKTWRQLKLIITSIRCRFPFNRLVPCFVTRGVLRLWRVAKTGLTQWLETQSIHHLIQLSYFANRLLIGKSFQLLWH